MNFYFINKYHKSLINNLEKNINIIYKNYEKKHNINEILKLKNCAKTNRKFFLANNLKLAIKLRLDGIIFLHLIKNHFQRFYLENIFIFLDLHII